MAFVNLKIAKLNLKSADTCSQNPQNLIICSENEEWKQIFHLSDIENLNCINNLYSFNINENINKMKCFKKNEIELDNPCQICGNNYFKIINNDAYINCYEYKEGYYFDDDILDYKQCYFSCKKCNISGNETEHNCIECKDEYKSELNFSIYKNCFKDDEKEIEINKRTKLIQNKINNLFSKVNIHKIDSGIDEKIFETNLLIIITSTKNQANNEKENITIIDLCECEIY